MEAVQSAVRREIRRVSEILVAPEDIDRMLRDEVLKRETMEGPPADAACRRVSKRSERSILKSNDKGAEPVAADPGAAPQSAP